MSSGALDLVALFLFDHGPSTLTDIASMTQIPLTTLRNHMTLNRGHRYAAILTIEDGIPVRRWSLLQPNAEEIANG